MTRVFDTQEPPLDRDGRVRPIIVSQYPASDERLNALVRAFETGDFRKLRVDAKTLLEASPEPEVRRATEDLLRRITPHPLILLFLAAAIALFVTMTIWVYTA